MNEKALRVLEYNKVVEMLENKASSSLGKSICQSLKPSSTFDEIIAWQKETTEATGMLIQIGTPPIGPFFELSSALKLATIGGCLSPKQLLEIVDSLRTSRTIKKYIASNGAGRDTYPVMFGLADRIHNHLELEKHI